jgi:hypothetical protein
MKIKIIEKHKIIYLPSINEGLLIIEKSTKEIYIILNHVRPTIYLFNLSKCFNREIIEIEIRNYELFKGTIKIKQ